MSLNNISREELEQYSYIDLTYMLLKENKKAMNTAVIFKEICELLGYSDEQFTDGIGDYYTSLTIDKRFVLLDSNEWDLRERHVVILVNDDDDDNDDDEDIFELEEEDEEIDEEEPDDEYDDDEIDEDSDDDDVLDELDDLTIISEDELDDE